MNTKSQDGIWQGMGMHVDWNEQAMGIGIVEIDSQHREWLTRFNRLVDAINDRKGEQLWADALLFFMRYTEKHFQAEEVIMKRTRSATEELNRQQHRVFQKRIQEISFMTWPLGATEKDVFTLEKELADWLRNHICTIDIQLRHAEK